MTNHELTRSLKSSSLNSQARTRKSTPSSRKSRVVDEEGNENECKLYEIAVSEHDQRYIDPDYLEYLESSSDDFIEEFVEVNRISLGGFFAKSEDDAIHQCAIVLGHEGVDELRNSWYEQFNHSMFVISATPIDHPTKLTVNACSQSDFNIRSSDWANPWLTGLIVLTQYAQELEVQVLEELKQSRKQVIDAQRIRSERIRVLKAMLDSTNRSFRELTGKVDGLLRK